MVAAASNKAVARTGSRRDISSRPSGVRWDKKMSNNCAFALLTYTAFQIYFVMGAIETEGMSIAPYFALVILVGFIIPVCRKFEKRWQKVAASGLTEQSIAAKFRRDQVFLWAFALFLPFVFVAAIKFIGSML